MKTLKLNAFALIAFLSIGISSCSDDEATPVVNPGPGSIAAQASANPDLSLLVKALGKAGLVQTLTDAGTYTVFAPNNAAFEAAGFTAAVIDALPAGDNGLKQTLLNHVLATKKTSTELTTGYFKTSAKGAASTTNNLNMYIDKGAKVKINGVSEVKSADILASNGVIHVVDKVIPLPSIKDLAVLNPNFSLLVAALTRADLVTTFTNAGTFTVFAPTNAAFTDAGLTLEVINNTPIPALTEILKNHVLGSTKTASELTTGYVKTLAKGAASTTNFLDMYVDLTSGVKLNGVATVDNSAPNVGATNGVIHVVNKVINLPTIATHAVANPAFNTLESIVTGASQAGVLAVLTGTTAYTVFAPTDAAFSAFNTELTTTANPTGLAGVSAANVTKVLQYHVIPGNKLAADLSAGSTSTALVGQNFILALTPTVKITDINGRISNVTPANVQCTNGVIHVLDKVLLPTL